eukprot:335000-Amphidinium_carterae.1
MPQLLSKGYLRLPLQVTIKPFFRMVIHRSQDAHGGCASYISVAVLPTVLGLALAGPVAA